MPSLENTIESILFVSQKPLSAKKLASLTGHPLEEVRDALTQLVSHYTALSRGIVLVQQGNEYQLATHPDNATIIQSYLQEEVTGELTRPALETLSVIAYQGPVRKSVIEKIRGVNCSLALRNLLVRGLIEEEEDKESMEKMYTLSFPFLHHLGVQDARNLPDYEKLNSLQILKGESDSTVENSI